MLFRSFSAYAFDSLPLALKEMWADLTDNSSTIAFDVRGDCDRSDMLISSQSSQAGNYQGLLVWIRKLLKVGLAESGLVGVIIECIPTPQSRWSRSVIQIEIQFFCQDSITCEHLAQRSDLRSICCGFQLLTAGDCYLKQQDNCLSCVISDQAIGFLNMFKF